ncbi:MAG TPA: hypothetical protein DEQ20_00765 [Desulfobulbaceae bacterium]|nr:hypothetical protein [Desulfobulbaceae bacterium]
MKKVLSTVAVSALILGSAAAASAAGIEMEGSVRARGLSEQTVVSTAATSNAYDSTVRLGMKSKPSDNLTGYILLETGNDTGDTYVWGSESAASLGKGGTQAGGMSNAGKLGLIQAWMAYNPTKEITLKVGHMPIAPGTKQFVNHDNSGDDAIVVMYDPNKNTHFHVATIKLAENTAADNSDDLDGYAFVATQKFNDAFKMGLNVVNLRGSAETSETSAPSTSVGSTTVGVLYPGLNLTNVGIDAAYKIGKLTLSGDVNLQFGTISDTGSTASEIPADGYAFQLAADYKIDNSSVGLLFAAGSGRDLDDTNSNNGLGNAFINFLGDSAYQVYIPGYRKVTPGSGTQAVLGQTGNSGLSNLTLYQLRANTATKCALTGKPLALRAALSYMKTTEDVNITNSAGATVRENAVGTEIDVVAAWSLTSNLTYQIEAAYLSAGDVYRTGSGTSGDAENAYFLRHGITMRF